MSGIDIQSGIVFFEGWYRTGTPPEIRQPVAEIYVLSTADEPPEHWFMEQQERLSHAPRWKDDYFQHWAEILGLGVAFGDISIMARWVIIVFDRTGRAITRVDYWPILQDGKFVDVAYADATSQLSNPAGKENKENVPLATSWF